MQLQKQLKKSDKYLLTKYEMIGMDPNSVSIFKQILLGLQYFKNVR